jgi:hypothetical protein
MIPVRRLNFYLLKVLHTEDTIDCEYDVAILEPPVIENMAFKILNSFCTTINNFNITDKSVEFQIDPIGILECEICCANILGDASYLKISDAKS